MPISYRSVAAIVREIVDDSFRIPNDYPPVTTYRDLYLVFHDVNPKNTDVKFYSDAAFTNQVTVSFPHLNPKKWDFDAYSYAAGVAAIRVHIVLADPAARFDSNMKDSLSAKDGHSQDYLRDLKTYMLNGEPVFSFACVIGGSSKGKMLGFNIHMIIMDADGSEAPYRYDPKIKNNGVICVPGDEVMYPECGE